MGKSEAQRLKVLEEENRQLKRLVADKELIIQTLNDILKKNFCVRRRSARSSGNCGSAVCACGWPWIKWAWPGPPFTGVAGPARKRCGFRRRSGNWPGPRRPLAIGASPRC